MKPLLIILVTAMAAVTATGRERSEAALLQAAADVLRPCGATTRAALMPAVLQRTEACSVVGYTDGGFAVVANDDRVEAVLAYALTAAYDSAAVPEGMQWWMNSVEQALAGRPRYSRSTTLQYNRTGVERVEPMLETKWGQGEPFNLQCPRKLYSNQGHMATGCIATAMSQIMRYHKYPETGDGDAIFDINSFLYADFAGTRYNWDAMLPDYKHSSYGAEQEDAVAELMMHCGVAVGMSYTDTESGAKGERVPGALRNHFRYNTNVSYRNRSYHTDAEWMGRIYSELAAGRPILYNGQDSKMSYGHAFVFDGYDEDGMVHVNWGWDGEYDGYFDINILNSGYMGMSFTDLQSMTMGIGVPDDEIEHCVELGLNSDLILYANSAGNNVYTLSDENFTIWNLNDYDLRGTIAMVMPTRLSTRVLATIETYPNVDEFTGDSVFSFKSFTYKTYPGEYEITIPKTLSDGTYYMYLAFREEGRTDWQPLWAAEGIVSFFQVTKKGSDFDVVGVRGQYTTPVDEVKAGVAPYSGDVYNMQGIKVNQSYRGIVIKNGKKTFTR